MKRLTGLGFTAIAIVIASSGLTVTARAQCTASGSGDSCNEPQTATMIAGRVVRLQMTAGSTALTAPTTTDFDAGFNATPGPTLTISANAPWTLLVRSAATFWTAANTSPGAPARTTKPAGDLKWSTASNGTFNALTTGDVTLVSGVATASSATTLYFQTLYNWTLDTPGNYSLSVVLTLTAP
jgi:hypothetical protein